MRFLNVYLNFERLFVLEATIWNLFAVLIQSAIKSDVIDINLLKQSRLPKVLNPGYVKGMFYD